MKFNDSRIALALDNARERGPRGQRRLEALLTRSAAGETQQVTGSVACTWCAAIERTPRPKTRSA
ncbi:hypothetical protein ASD65_14025 [Microbacterium sp. Root61]|nr:hypothetical protein ASD65_14025 [Microbacterium sp. Root61]